MSSGAVEVHDGVEVVHLMPEFPGALFVRRRFAPCASVCGSFSSQCVVWDSLRSPRFARASCCSPWCLRGLAALAGLRPRYVMLFVASRFVCCHPLVCVGCHDGQPFLMGSTSSLYASWRNLSASVTVLCGVSLPGAAFGIGDVGCPQQRFVDVTFAYRYVTGPEVG
jgi:hypothetical protein